MRILWRALLMSTTLLLARSAAAQPTPPKAAVRPTVLTHHGVSRTDPYYWLRERENPEVIAYLEAENAYTAAAMAHTEALQQRLYDEMRGRIQEDEASAPYRKHHYWYYTRYVQGGEYPVHARRRERMEAPEEVMLDVNALAAGRGYYAAHGLSVSPDERLLAYAADTTGRRIYTIYVKDLATGALLADVIPEATSNVAWAADSRTLFYARQDPQTLRSYRIYRHTLGADPAGDVLVYEETDDTFSAHVFKTKSDRYLMIRSSQTLSTEYRYLEADRPEGEFRVVQPRRRDLEYDVDHYGDSFYIRTNLEAKNFRMMRAPVAAPGAEHWEEVIAHRPDALIDGFEIFKDFMVLAERKDGLSQLRVRPWSGEGEHYIGFDEPAYALQTGPNPEFDTPLLRFEYASMTTPTRTYDYDMRTRTRLLRKQKPVLGGFRSEDYVTERLFATAADGARIPISLVRRTDTPLGGRSPLLLYGYGSYGYSTDAGFSSTLVSLLDRGFVFAIAHIRGGEEMGRAWYEDGKLLKKQNTFTDFIACAEHLKATGYADPERLYARGGSAGGLLMGAVMNLRPDLFHGIIAAVPFVDVVTTMLDESIPLTTFEYDEWGNPNEPEYFKYMLAYSPYDNVTARDYPHLLIMTGLHDSQVQYWEPAKWAARLRALKTDDHRLLLKTNMEAGHGGASGRFEYLKELALQYAFLIDLAGAD